MQPQFVPMSLSYVNKCRNGRGGDQELDCAAETASPLMPTRGRKSHRALPCIYRDEKGSQCGLGDSTPSSFFILKTPLLMRQDPHQVSKTPPVRFRHHHTTLLSRWLGELKAGVHANSVAQLVAQDALFAVVGQLEQVEAC